MKVNGKMICKMVMEKKYGLMDQILLVCLKMVKRKEEVNLFGNVTQYMKASFMIIKYKDMEYINGGMVENTKGNGRMIR